MYSSLFPSWNSLIWLSIPCGECDMTALILLLFHKFKGRVFHCEAMNKLPFDSRIILLGLITSPCPRYPGIILCMCQANERRRYIVTSSIIGWAHTQNDPWIPGSGTKSSMMYVPSILGHHKWLTGARYNWYLSSACKIHLQFALFFMIGICLDSSFTNSLYLFSRF